jgi:hypothetical protein
MHTSPSGPPRRACETRPDPVLCLCRACGAFILSATSGAGAIPDSRDTGAVHAVPHGPGQSLRESREDRPSTPYRRLRTRRGSQEANDGGDRQHLLRTADKITTTITTLFKLYRLTDPDPVPAVGRGWTRCSSLMLLLSTSACSWLASSRSIGCCIYRLAVQTTQLVRAGAGGSLTLGFPASLDGTERMTWMRCAGSIPPHPNTRAKAIIPRSASSCDASSLWRNMADMRCAHISPSWRNLSARLRSPVRKKSFGFGPSVPRPTVLLSDSRHASSPSSPLRKRAGDDGLVAVVPETYPLREPGRQVTASGFRPKRFP